MRRLAKGIAVIVWMMFAGLLVGCQVYLHDDSLQKQTAAALAAYKEADVPGAIKATIAAQEKFDEQMLNSIVAEDAAARDLEISGLLESRSHDALAKKVDARLAEIGGLGSQFDERDWQRGLVALKALRTELASRKPLVDLMARKYREAGGKDFKECKNDLQLPASVDAQLSAASTDLKLACAASMPTQESLDKKVAEYDQRVCQTNPGSLLAKTCAEITNAEALIKADKAAADATKAGLEAAKVALADAREANATEASISEKLEAFKAELDKADKLVSELGATDFKPTAALTAIEFRETNLCDVLFAGIDASCTGKKVDDKAKKTNEALIGLIAGLTKVIGPPPETDALTIALAYQNGLQRAAQASLDGQKLELALLQSRQQALVQEVEHLLRVRAWLSAAKAKPKPTPIEEQDAQLVADVCAARKIWVQLREENCAARVTFANAITVYNLAWAEGRTAERVANSRLTMRLTTTNLRVSQAIAASRDEILTTALTGLDAFGQGGVTTQTIAELLQTVGIAAIATE